MHSDHGLHLDDAGGNLDEAEVNVSYWATRHIENFRINTRRPHISQYAPACRNSRNWLAVALEQDVRSAARWVFQDLIWFSAWPRRQ